MTHSSQLAAIGFGRGQGLGILAALTAIPLIAA